MIFLHLARFWVNKKCLLTLFDPRGEGGPKDTEHSKMLTYLNWMFKSDWNGLYSTYNHVKKIVINFF